jgi:hypothetical protein
LKVRYVLLDASVIFSNQLIPAEALASCFSRPSYQSWVCE